MGTLKRTGLDKRMAASKALMVKLEELETSKGTGRVVVEVSVNRGGIVNASISTQEPVFNAANRKDK